MVQFMKVIRYRWSNGLITKLDYLLNVVYQLVHLFNIKYDSNQFMYTQRWSEFNFWSKFEWLCTYFYIFYINQCIKRDGWGTWRSRYTLTFCYNLRSDQNYIRLRLCKQLYNQGCI